MNLPEAPFYVSRGARPRPLPPEEVSAHTGRPTVILGIVMMAWLLVMLILSLFPSGGPRSLDPITIGRGVVVSPAPGWTSGQDVLDVGTGAVALKRAGALVVFTADAYSWPAENLFAEVVQDLRNQMESFRYLPPRQVRIAGDVVAQETLFSGTAGGGQMEGEMVAASKNGTGVVMVAFAPPGQLPRVQNDIDEMLGGLVIP